MGVRGLMSLLKEFAPKAIVETTIKDYGNKFLAFDAFHIIYLFCIALRGKTCETRKDGKIVSHLRAIFFTIVACAEHNIVPIFVFDGKPPHLKQDEMNERSKKKEKVRDELKILEEAMKDAYNEKDAKKRQQLMKRTFSIKGYMIKDCIVLCKLFGVPYIEAPEEADAQCAALSKSLATHNKTWGVVAEDMDMLAYGTPILLRNFSASKDGKKKIQEIHLGSILNQMALTKDQFVDECILLGTDYKKNESCISGLKGRMVHIKYKKYGKDIRKLVAGLTEENNDAKRRKRRAPYHIPDNFIKVFNEIKQYYTKSAEVIDPQLVNTKWTKPNIDMIANMMCKENEFDTYIIDKLNSFADAYNRNPFREKDAYITKIKKNTVSSRPKFNSQRSQLFKNAIIGHLSPDVVGTSIQSIIPLIGAING